MIQIRGFFTIFVILSAVLLISGQNPYCRICRDHTMCIYTNRNPVCAAQQTGLNANQKSEVLTAHNSFRSLVARGGERRGNPGPQPRARSMPSMTWDNELESIAQRWANQCKFQHDSCRNVERFGVGQNIAITWTTGTLAANVASRLVTMWYEEVAKFDSRQVERVTNFNEVGHYTQMLWATSVKLGCGYVAYRDGNKNTAFLVCNYGPAGNIVNGKISIGISPNEDLESITDAARSKVPHLSQPKRRGQRAQKHSFDYAFQALNYNFK